MCSHFRQHFINCNYILVKIITRPNIIISMTQKKKTTLYYKKLPHTHRNCSVDVECIRHVTFFFIILYYSYAVFMTFFLLLMLYFSIPKMVKHLRLVFRTRGATPKRSRIMIIRDQNIRARENV